MPDLRHRAIRYVERGRNQPGVAAHQRDAGGMHGDIGAVAHGHAHIGRRQRRCVVDTIAHHSNGVAAFLKFYDPTGLFTRQHFGHDFALFRAQAQPARHGIRCTAVIAGDHHGPDAARAQRSQRLFCTGFGRIAKGHQRTQA